MLDKKATVPGARIIVDRPRDGVSIPFSKGEPKPDNDCVRIMTGMLGFFGPAIGAVPGTRLTIVKKPRKIGGINVARVATEDGTEGEVYWCELRVSCKHLPSQ